MYVVVLLPDFPGTPPSSMSSTVPSYPPDLSYNVANPRTPFAERMAFTLSSGYCQCRTRSLEGLLYGRNCLVSACKSPHARNTTWNRLNPRMDLTRVVHQQKKFSLLKLITFHSIPIPPIPPEVPNRTHFAPEHLLQILLLPKAPGADYLVLRAHVLPESACAPCMS